MAVFRRDENGIHVRMCKSVACATYQDLVSELSRVVAELLDDQEFSKYGVVLLPSANLGTRDFQAAKSLKSTKVSVAANMHCQPITVISDDMKIGKLIFDRDVDDEQRAWISVFHDKYARETLIWGLAMANGFYLLLKDENEDQDEDTEE